MARRSQSLTSIAPRLNKTTNVWKSQPTNLLRKTRKSTLGGSKPGARPNLKPRCPRLIISSETHWGTSTATTTFELQRVHWISLSLDRLSSKECLLTGSLTVRPLKRVKLWNHARLWRLIKICPSRLSSLVLKQWATWEILQ